MKNVFLVGLTSCVLIMTARSDALDSGNLGLRLEASVGGPDSITCKLSVKNVTTNVVKISVANREPPFMVTVLDQQGEDLNKEANLPIKRGKSLSAPAHGQLLTLTLQPGEVRLLQGTIVLHSPGGASLHLASGKYSVQARLVDVNYVNGKYDTTVFQSNDSQIVVK